MSETLSNKIWDIIYEIGQDHGEIVGYSQAAKELEQLLLQTQIDLLKWVLECTQEEEYYIYNNKISELTQQLNQLKQG